MIEDLPCGCDSDRHCFQAESLNLLWHSLQYQLENAEGVRREQLTQDYNRAMRLYWWHRHPSVVDPTSEWNVKEAARGAQGQYIVGWPLGLPKAEGEPAGENAPAAEVQG